MVLDEALPQYEVNDSVKESTKYCNDHKCIISNTRLCGKSIAGDKPKVLCKGDCHDFCWYMMKYEVNMKLCMCPIRQEIWRKYYT